MNSNIIFVHLRCEQDIKLWVNWLQNQLGLAQEQLLAQAKELHNGISVGNYSKLRQP
jgi:hypothetical protein